MAGPKLDIISGDVTDVQLSSDTYEVPDPARAPRRRGGREARASVEGRIIGKMRIFVRTDAGTEDDYDFEDAKVGVRDGHRVVIVRASDSKIKTPVNLVLINVSNNEREEFTRNFALFTDRTPALGPRWKAAGLSLAMFAIGFLLSALVISPERNLAWWLWWPAFFSFLAYPVFWALAWTWEAITRRIRSEQKRNGIRAEIEGRLAAHIRPSA